MFHMTKASKFSTTFRTVGQTKTGIKVFPHRSNCLSCLVAEQVSDGFAFPLPVLEDLHGVHKLVLN